MRFSYWGSNVCSSDRERCDALLNASTAAVVEADDRRADEHRLFHHLADFLGMTLRQRAAENGEILAEDIDEAAVDRPRSGDDAVAGDFLVLHPEIDAIMFDLDRTSVVSGKSVYGLVDLGGRRRH